MQRMQTSVEDRGVERVSSRGKIQQLLGRLRQTSIGLRTQFVGTLSNAAATPPVRAAELKLPIRKPIHKKSQRHTHTPRMSEGATKMVHGRSGRRLRVPQAKRAVAADDSDDHAFVAAMAKMTEDQMQARQALVDTEVAEEKKRLTAELRVAESTNTHLLGAAKKAFEQAREEIDAIGRKVSHQYSRNPRDKLTSWNNVLQEAERSRAAGGELTEYAFAALKALERRQHDRDNGLRASVEAKHSAVLERVQRRRSFDKKIADLWKVLA